jgi:broad specificity phosphatase PhoE
MTRILLLRHGQSEWNAEGRWQGQSDIALTDLGRQQAFAASQRLGVVDALVCSDLLRASDTAQILSAQLGVGPVVVEPLFRERDAGEWSGLTTAQIEAGWPGYLAERRRPERFEPEADALARLLAGIDAVHELVGGEGEVIVVTHGGLVHALEHHHGHDFERLPNLAGRWVTHHGDKVELGDRLILIDDDLSSIPAAI